MNHDPLDFKAQEKATADRKTKQRLIHDQEADDLKWLLSDKRGRRFMWGLLEKTGCHRNPYNGVRGDTDFRCGEMNIGQKYEYLILGHCPEKYTLMLTERNEHDKRDNDRRNASNT